MKNHKFAVFALSAFVLFGCNQSDKSVDEANTSGESQSQNAIIKTTKQTSKGLEIEYDSITLENGLEVIFHIDRSDPVVAVALTAHVGSAREIPGRTGFAHLFEHLLFLESENLGKGGLDKMSARIGGSGANGSTSRDRTNYFQTVPKNALEKMIWAEADKLGYFINTVTEPVLAKEKQVVKNEKRQSGDNRPYGHTQYVIDKNLYPKGHPYSWQVIGSLQDLQNATLTDVKEFFKRWYVPNNVSLVISGDFDQAQAEQWIHKYFDEIPRGPEVVRTQKQPVTLKQSKRLFFEDNFANVPELTITWPTVPLYHPDSYPLQILRSLLSDGKKAPMNQLLVDELKLTSQVRMGNYDSELAGQTSIRVRGFQNTDLNTVYEAIQKGFVNFETNGFSKSDLARIKAEQETAFYQGLSSALGKGFQLAQYQIYVDDPGFINQDVKNILAVTKKDVWRVYSQYIKDKHYIATSFVPKGQKQLALKDSVGAKVVEENIVVGAEDNFDASQQATYTRTKSSFDRSAEPEYDEAPIVVKVPDVWQVTLKNKMGVFSIANNEVPLVNFNLQLDGGMLFENPNKIGVASLVANMMNKGTKQKTPEQLENAIKQLGARIVFSADKQHIQVSGNTLAKNYLKTMELVTEMLLEPRWDVNEFKLLQESTVSDIKQQLASPRAVASNQFERLLYGEQHLLANNLLGSEQSVTAITLEDLKSYYTNFFSPNLANLHIVGDISRDIARQSLMSLEKNWLPKDVLIPELKPIIKPEKARVYFYDIPNAKQSMIVIGNPALKATDKDYYPAQVMNYRLGGGSFASQLTQELRESKGYTYGVRSGFIGGKLTGYFQISSGVRANVTFEATQLIKDIASQYQASFSDNDLQVTKGFYSKSNARLFETPNAKLNILSDMSQYSLGADYVQQRADVLERLTLVDIKSLAEKYIQPNKMIYLIVGDAETQLSRMKELGYGEPVLLNP